jgi:uncharacterized RDD family membrane protein YckC
MESDQWPKVRLPQRIQADAIDSVIAIAIMYLPVILADAFAAHIPDGVARASLLGIPLGILFMLFRDYVGKGTSPGKRVLRLALIRLETGRSVAACDVWKRNLTDIIPVFNALDFLGVCIDRRGQKVMDRRLGIQLVHRGDLLLASDDGAS